MSHLSADFSICWAVQCHISEDYHLHSHKTLRFSQWFWYQFMCYGRLHCVG